MKKIIIKKDLQNQKDGDTSSSVTSSQAQSSRPETAPIGAPLNDSSRANRPKRIPLGSQKRMDAPQRPGFIRRFVNDRDGRVEKAILGGYTAVEGDFLMSEQSKVPGSLGKQRRLDVGRGTQAILMEIPEELYREDQEDKIKANNELVRDVNDVSGRGVKSYIPDNRADSVQVERRSTQ